MTLGAGHGCVSLLIWIFASFFDMDELHHGAFVSFLCGLWEMEEEEGGLGLGLILPSLHFMLRKQALYFIEF